MWSQSVHSHSAPAPSKTSHFQREQTDDDSAENTCHQHRERFSRVGRPTTILQKTLVISIVSGSAVSAMSQTRLPPYPPRREVVILHAFHVGCKAQPEHDCCVFIQVETLPDKVEFVHQPRRDSVRSLFGICASTNACLNFAANSRERNFKASHSTGSSFEQPKGNHTQHWSLPMFGINCQSGASFTTLKLATVSNVFSCLSGIRALPFAHHVAGV